jgi:putative DNA primase/helicase
MTGADSINETSKEDTNVSTISRLGAPSGSNNAGEQAVETEMQSGSSGCPADSEKPAREPRVVPVEPVRAARAFYLYLQNEEATVLRHWRGSWWRWECSHWVQAEDRAIERDLLVFTSEAVEPGGKPWNPNPAKVRSVIQMMGIEHLLPQEVQPPCWIEGAVGPEVVVACHNGLLDVVNRELLPHTPDFFTTTNVPFDYDREAAEPKHWQAFLESLWGEDREQIRALQEWFGYVISGRTDMHKILLIVGPTRAGKGVITRTLAQLMGTNNVVSPTLSSLTGEFGLAPLIGKPLATVSDARLDGRGSHVVVERLLSISGEDDITVNIKYKPQWTGRLPARFMICSNEQPQLGDNSGAIAGRIVFLTLTRSWLDKEDRDLENRLRRELPGIMNWALDGLARLIERGRFTEPQSTRKEREQMRELASPITTFVADRCELGTDLQVPCDQLWGEWQAWAKRTGNREGTREGFGKNLRSVDPKIDRDWDGGSPRERVYYGITLRTSGM